MGVNVSRAAAAAAEGDNVVFAVGGVVDLLHAFWLVAAFSLVYCATKHEPVGAILDHSWRFGAKVAAALTWSGENPLATLLA